ncbi:MAG: AAA family ATPase [Candidatus Accumulibacter sp.]|jgi:ABC-type thiamine transport system ATPase subunit|nr:AAA family ATPase [Accumulibacter sp.]
MITELSLKNFRCFQDFTLEGIRPVTLIAGANNVGKSTILESIFLFMSRNSSDVFLRLNGFRGMQTTSSPFTIWEPLFFDMDMRNGISIAILDDGNEQSITLCRDDSLSLSSIAGIPPLSVFGSAEGGTQPNIGPDKPLSNSYPLKLGYKERNVEHVSHFLLTESTRLVLLNRSPAPTIPVRTQYIGSWIFNHAQIASWLSALEISNRKDRCIEIARVLEPRTRDISVTNIDGVGGVYVDIGLTKKLSLNVLGGGVNKYMHIALCMLANPGSILLVDEMENGFHYSLFPKLWKIIGELAAETKCQVFATTHSYECISGAVGLADSDANDDLFRFIRLDRQDGIVVPRAFDNESFGYAIRNDWEVR